MAYCKQCGAYIPIGETACPACGYDPDAEARAEREAKERAEAQARAERERAEAEARRKAEQEKAWAEQERQREEEARRRAEQRRRWEQDPRNHGYSAGAAQSQYTSQRTGQSGASQGQYASERTGQTWVPPWTQGGQAQSQTQQQTAQDQSQTYSQMRREAQNSVDAQKMSVLSYLGPLFLIPLLTRGNDAFTRFHANQGLVKFLATAAISVLASATGSGLLVTLGSIFNIYCMVKGINNVLKGKMEPLPFIGNIKILK